MPYEIIPEARGILVRYHGRLTAPEVLRSVEAVTEDPAYDLIRYRINDLLGVTDFEFSDELMEQVAAVSSGGAESRRRRGLRGLIAQVTTDPRLIAVLQRYEALGIVPYQFRMFANVADARAWIDATLATTD